MSIIITIVMVVAGIGALVGLLRARAGVKSGRTLAIACSVVVLVLAVWKIMAPNQNQRLVNEVTASVMRYDYACGKTLGQYLAGQFSGKRALVLVGPPMPGAESSPVDRPMLDGLKDGLGEEIKLVGIVPFIPPVELRKQILEEFLPSGVAAEDYLEDSAFLQYAYEMVTISENWFSADGLASFLKERAGTFDLLISTIGLPTRLLESPLLEQPGALPEIALLDPWISDVEGLPSLVKQGVVDAMVIYQPGVVTQRMVEQAPRDIEEAFAKRYLLVTPQNVEEMANKYPGLL